MMKFSTFFLILFLVCSLLAGCQGAVANVSVGPSVSRMNIPAEKMLTLGLISNDPAGVIEAYQPLADLLGSKLGSFGVQYGKVRVAPDLETMEGFLKNGQVDLFFENSYLALIVYDDVGAIPLVRQWKRGLAEYYSLFVANKESGITRLSDLRGKTIVFENPESTPGYLLPKAHLMRLGYTLVQKGALDTSVAEDQVGYVFAGAEANALAWVLHNKFPATAVPQTTYQGLPQEQKDRLTVLEQTPPVPTYLVLARPDLSPGFRQSLFELLVNLDKSPEGLAVLKALDETSRFEPILPDPAMAMRRLQELFGPVR